ncbi:MAG TPA: DUF4333 domain-containing protein [Solirubrobacteraceae bacterium]|nr:DUF4333 domain-containing protein [Solirubrobacteraceae bacterium]
MKGEPKPAALRTLRLASLVSAVLVAVFICACGSSSRSLDSAKVERAIATSILKEHGLYTTVACPAKVPQQAGHVFTCTARLEVGAYPVTVIETNGSGRVSYANQQPLVVLNIAKVQRAIEASIFSQRHLRAAASCPAEVLQRAGLVFSCTARINGGAGSYPFRVSEVDSAGHVRYLAA